MAALVCAWISVVPFLLATSDFVHVLFGVEVDGIPFRHATGATAGLFALWASVSNRVVRVAGYMGLVFAPITLVGLLFMPLYLQDRPALWYWLPIVMVCAALGCLQSGFRTQNSTSRRAPRSG